MQRNYKLIVSIIALTLTSLCAFAQDEVEYKDVILDGKPAKLNVATGKITLVKPADITKGKTSEITEDSNSDVISSENPLDFHVVQEGETLLDVSRKYKVSLTELKKANNLETTLINKGQKLRVKNFNKNTESTSHTHANSTYERHSEVNNSNVHIVDKDETLYSLSKRYNLSLNELKSLNNLSSNLITIGQKLRVRDFGTENEVDSILVWTVAIDDTLFSIARKSGTTVEAIKQLNGLTSNLILVGQKLRLK